jgi:hypothetical protein
MRNKIFFFCASFFTIASANAQAVGNHWTWSDVRPAGNMGTFRNFNYYTHNTAMDGSFVNFNDNNSKGRRYLFDGWAKGKVITSTGYVIASDSIDYNFDKMNSSLLVTTNKKDIIEVNRNDISAFVLNDEKNTYEFERVDAIDVQSFLEVVTKKNDGYILYKSVKTIFEKANYQTNGISESGHTYDLYTDEFKYYVVLPDGKEFRSISLKSKSIKEAFANDAKAIEYISAHKSDIIDEKFIKSMVEQLNQ